MAIVYEHQPGGELGPDDVDGMEEFLEDEPLLGTEWDAEVEDPPWHLYGMKPPAG